MEKIMVCGGAGFIGSHLANSLINDGHDLSVVDNLSSGNKERVDKRARFYHADVCDMRELRSIFAKEMPKYVVYEVSKVVWKESEKNPCDDVNANIIGLLNVLMCCAEFSVRKIIFASTIAVYGNSKSSVVCEKDAIDTTTLPKSTYYYSLTKYAGEMFVRHYCELHRLPYTILRYSHVYGPGQTSEGEVFVNFARRFLAKESVEIQGDGEQGRDFVFVNDVIDATKAALHNGDNMTLNIGGGKITTINELLDGFIAVCGYTVKVAHSDARNDGANKFYMDIGAAKNILSWVPKTELYDGIRYTLDFFSEIASDMI